MRLRRAGLLALAVLGSCSNPQLPRFEAALAANDSATAALEGWCTKQGIASPPAIRALAERTARRPASAAIRAALGVTTEEPVAYRHVRLACGDTVLSVAHNWYVPARLTPAMNDTLETSDTPFGKVTAPLGYRRDRLAARRGQAEECPKGTTLSHRALLRLADGQAISLVVECYTAENMR